MKTCPLCKASNPDNQEFCLNCSGDLTTVDADTPATTSSDDAPASSNKDRGPDLRPGDLKLVVKAGDLPDMAYLLDEPNMTIGRHDPVDGYFPDIDLYDQEPEGDWTVSKAHARLSFQDGRLYIIDLGSVNGTYINDPERITPHRDCVLNVGDVVAFGSRVVLKLKEYTSS